MQIIQRSNNRHKLIQFCPLFLYLFLGIMNLPAQTLIISDDFESGQTSLWSDFASVRISDELPKGGVYSARFRFNGVPEGEDSWAEARFDLGGYYEELSIKFDLYIPENYVHRANNAGQGWANNKFFRLWTDTYSDLEKVGATMYNQFDNGNSTTGNNTYASSIGNDYRTQASNGMSSSVTTAANFITLEGDRGKWMSVVIYIKASTDSSPAEFSLYKNGQLFLATTFNNNWVPGTQGYRKGYLLGWANSGFTEETILYIDNVEFYDGFIIGAIFSNGFE
ncbi:MAG: polysaccharide lyase [Xanthomonadales bacterium]|nr:polysaccharide lyase [Xanthomonadales bacterium]